MDDADLLRYFADLSRRLMAQPTVQDTMRTIVDAAVVAIDGCDHASISHMRGRSLVSGASSDDIGTALDGIQTGAGEGPCLDAIRTGVAMGTSDLGADPRWPRYGPLAVEATSVRSSVGLPLHDGRTVIGALNLFSRSVGGLDGDVEGDAAAAVLATHATAALAAALRREGLEEALRSRDLIGQAKGMLMARAGVDEEAAFALLVRASQRMQVKLVEVARQLVAGQLSDPSSGRRPPTTRSA